MLQRRREVIGGPAAQGRADPRDGRGDAAVGERPGGLADPPA